MSSLTVGELIARNNGVITMPSGQNIIIPGHVINVVQGVKYDTFSASPAATTYADVSGLSATITPKSDLNKILVLLDIYVGTGSYQVKGRLKRNGTPIFTGTPVGTRPGVTFTTNVYAGGNEAYSCVRTGGAYYDAPGLSTAVQYTVDIAAYSTYAVYVNRNHNFQVSAGDYDTIPISTITLLEIAQ